MSNRIVAASKCSACNGRREWHKFFPHPVCVSEADIIVKARCMVCNPPADFRPEDVVQQVHHQVIGKENTWGSIGRKKTHGNYFIIPIDNIPEKKIDVREYEPEKKKLYSDFFRKVKWDNTKDYPFPIGSSCPLNRKST